VSERTIQSRPRGRVQVRLSFDEGTGEMFEALRAMALQARAPYLYYLVRLGQTVQSTLMQSGLPLAAALPVTAASNSASVPMATALAALAAPRSANQHAEESLAALKDWVIDPGPDVAGADGLQTTRQ
jgi:hypothetical protein